MTRYPELPPEVVDALNRARRLEYWSLFWFATIILVMYLALGGSQAMRAAWIEDILGAVPSVLFLIALPIERRPPTRGFPYGFHRVGSLAFFAAACALIVFGAYLLYESGRTLVRAEHPTVGSFRVLGHEVWMGWAMIAALTYSAIPPVVLGRMKNRLAVELSDHLLYTDADMMRADWSTSLAGILGILGIWFGLWWADAVAAGAISLSILWDGLRNGRVAVSELMDGAPRRLSGAGLSPDGERIREGLLAASPGADVRIRQTGRFIRAAVLRGEGAQQGPLAGKLAGDDAWRLVEVTREIGEEDDGITERI